MERVGEEAVPRKKLDRMIPAGSSAMETRLSPKPWRIAEKLDGECTGGETDDFYR